MIFFHGAGAGQERTRAFECQLLQGFRTIEQRFPKPQVVGPIPTEGASSCPRMCTVGIGISRVDPNYVFEIFEDGS